MDLPIHFTLLIWVELSLAALLVLSALSVRLEYTLFLYGLALGFPGLAYPVDAAVSARLDDLLVVVLFVRTIFWVPQPLTRSQKRCLTWVGVFLVACVGSAGLETALGSLPPVYETAKMAGCAMLLFVLPRVLQTARRLRFLISGMMCGGVALAFQIFQHLGSSAAKAFTNIQELKSAATFERWNGNTVGQAAILFGFAAALGWHFFAQTRKSRLCWSVLVVGFALLPAAMFVRGTTLSIAGAIILFLSLTERGRWGVLLAVAGIGAVLYLDARGVGLVQDATAVNVTTGEGFSHRFERWDMALRAIRTQPVVGQGFGQELGYLTLLGSEGRAHDAYLTVAIELGLAGLALFLFVLAQFVRAGWLLYRDAGSKIAGAIILALMAALIVDSFALPTLYWEKLPTIALCTALAVIGLCEREYAEVAQSEPGRWPSEVVVSHP